MEIETQFDLADSGISQALSALNVLIDGAKGTPLEASLPQLMSARAKLRKASEALREVTGADEEAA
jgi:hypothetical protein